MAQADLFDSGARARSADPKTSKDAAASVRKMRASHRLVLRAFDLYGDMTDEQLAEALGPMMKAANITMSPSGIRSRRSELSKANMDRIVELTEELVKGLGFDEDVAHHKAVDRLRVEGLRSPLWDTGKRGTTASGRATVVWGIAK